MKKIIFIIVLLVLLIYLPVPVVKAQEWEWYDSRNDNVNNVLSFSPEKKLYPLPNNFTINGSGEVCKEYFLKTLPGILGESKLIFKYELEGDDEIRLLGYPLIENIGIIFDETKKVPTIQFVYDPSEGFDSEGYWITNPIFVILRVASSVYRKTWCLIPIHVFYDIETNLILVNK